MTFASLPSMILINLSMVEFAPTTWMSMDLVLRPLLLVLKAVAGSRCRLLLR